jgi:hypothetical protein
MELTDELRHHTEDIIRLTACVAKLEEHNHERSRTAIVTAPPEASGHGADAPERRATRWMAGRLRCPRSQSR